MRLPAVLRNTKFAAYWTAALTSSLGDAIFMVTLSWMAVKSAHSGTLLGLLMGVMSFPPIIFSILGGVWVDRNHPKWLMVGSNGMRMVAIIFLIIAHSSGDPSKWPLFAVALLFGTVDAVFWPAALALKQSLVDQTHLVRSNALLMMAFQGAQIAGPAIAGVLITNGRFTPALGACIGAYSLSTLTLLMLTTSRSLGPASNSHSLWNDVRESIQFMRKQPLLAVTSLSALMVNISLAAVMVAIPLLAHSQGYGSRGFGLMTAAMGMGGAIGAIGLLIIPVARPTPRMTLTACGIEGVLFILLAGSHNLWSVVVLLGLVGIVEVAINTIAPSVNQHIIPAAIFGRVISFTIVLMQSGEPVAKALAGWAITRLGVAASLSAAGLLELAVALIAFFMPPVRQYARQSRREQQIGS